MSLEEPPLLVEVAGLLALLLLLLLARMTATKVGFLALLVLTTTVALCVAQATMAMWTLQCSPMEMAMAAWPDVRLVLAALWVWLLIRQVQ
jgi:hypothetical protein